MNCMKFVNDLILSIRRRQNTDVKDPISNNEAKIADTHDEVIVNNISLSCCSPLKDIKKSRYQVIKQIVSPINIINKNTLLYKNDMPSPKNYINIYKETYRLYNQFYISEFNL